MKKVAFTFAPLDKEQLIEDIVDDEVLRDFFIKNDVDTEYIEKHLSTLYNFKIEKDRCIGCAGTHECRQDVFGHEPLLQMADKTVKVLYQECAFFINHKRQSMQQEFVDALYMPKMIYQAALDDFDFTRGENRTLIHNRLTNFITRYMNGEDVQGLYLHGAYQKGKTYCLAALANELSKRNVRVIIAYYPDLVREIKSRISNNTVEMMISKLKQVDVLMLDDIGGESPSAWIRDEVLGPLLQHRLLDHKPTFFSSNVNQKALTHYMILNKQMAEKMKAARIEERIKSLSEEIEM